MMTDVQSRHNGMLLGWIHDVSELAEVALANMTYVSGISGHLLPYRMPSPLLLDQASDVTAERLLSLR